MENKNQFSNHKVKLSVVGALVAMSAVWWSCSSYLVSDLVPESLTRIDQQNQQLTPDRPSRLVKVGDDSENQKDVLEYKDKKSGKVQKRELTRRERSFVLMVQVFNEFLIPNNKKRTDKDFIRALQTLGLTPRVARDRQGIIDDFSIVRTVNSLPGIRYIHGQFEGNEVHEMQHLSFEIPKGPKAFENAVALLQMVMPAGYKMPDTAEGMVIFRQGEYVVWLKKLDTEDLLNHPFNVYDQSDVGTIRVAVEKDPHAHQD